MNNLKTFLSLIIVNTLFSVHSFSQDTLANILKEELTREYETLKNQPVTPYYMEYRVDDIKSFTLSTSFGSLVNKDEESARILTTLVRVGDYNFDNSHEIKGSYSGGIQPYVINLPIENKAEAIKVSLWQATHYAYRSAVDAFSQVQSGIKDDQRSSPVADFSKEKPEVYFVPVDNSYKLDTEMWVARLKKYSEPFVSDEKIVSADATLSFINQRKYLVNTDGTNIVQNATYAQLQVVAVTKAEDGSLLPLYKSYYAFTPEGFPSNASIVKDISGMKLQLQQIRNSPIAEAYSGPAILSPSAAAVFFHEIFGHRVEGHRLKSNYDSQTFKTQIGTKVLPKYMNISCDPTIKKLGNQDMYGYYKFDDQGILASKVDIVEKGVLKNFLMSRNPIENFQHSNGHGRSQAGMLAVSRQSNLIVTSTKSLEMKELRKKMIAECKKQHKEYGFLFDEVVGGFTLTSRYSPNVFNVMPTVVYKIYVDGRPDELVRGVNFIGTPLAIFSEVAATGDSTGVFTGFCGAESGNIPVTAVSPALFIKKLETQKQPEGISSMPILPRPDFEKIKK